jgi:hypothetical protein
MRRRTQGVVAAICVTVLLLLALGALPGLLRTGDPYYVTATPVAEGEVSTQSASPGDSPTRVNASALSVRRYPYTTGALAGANATTSARSEPYWRGPVGLKEVFTHSPFDEQAALRGQYPNDTSESGVLVAANGTFYRVAVGQ